MRIPIPTPWAGPASPTPCVPGTFLDHPLDTDTLQPSGSPHRGAQEQERVRLVSVGGQHGAQGEVGANISVEHEEGLGAPSQDLIPEMVETTSCAQRGKFLQVPVPRDPRASSEITGDRYHEPGHRALPVPRICLPKAHRETQYIQGFRNAQQRNLLAGVGNFWQMLTQPTPRTGTENSDAQGTAPPQPLQHM